jgi:hypothetical protein
MKTRVWILLAAACGMFASAFATSPRPAREPDWSELGTLRPLPNPTPFAEGGELRRVEGTFEVGEFMGEAHGKNVPLRYGALKFGNKEIAIRRDGKRMEGRDHGIKINIDGRKHLSISLVPAWNIDSSACEVSLNKAEDTLDLRIPYLDKETGKNEQLVCRIWKAGPSRARITWRNSAKKQDGAEKGILVYVNCTDDMPAGATLDTAKYRGKKVMFGDAEWGQRTREELLASDPNRRNGVARQSGMSGPFTVDAEHLEQTATVDLGTAKYSASEQLEVLHGGDIDRWSVGMMCGMQPGSEIAIDLHYVRVNRKRTTAVNGIDFEAIDGFHYELPPTKNIFRNPSFERGMLFWRYEQGGAVFTLKEPQDHYAVVPGGKFGEHCLHIRPYNTGVQGLQSFPMPLEAGAKYTLSVWVKYLASKVPERDRAGARADVKLAISNAARGGPIKVAGPWGDKGEGSRQTVWHSNGWTRISRTFMGDAFGLIVYLGGNDCLFDSIQLEKGERATDFVAPPLEGHLITDDPDNHLHFGRESAFDWRLVGANGVRGNVTLTVTDAYGETLGVTKLRNVGPGVYPLRKGRFVWPLKGVFLVRADYDVGGRKWFEFERLAVVQPLANRHPTKNLFACFAHSDIQNRGEDKQRRLMEWGWGSTTWIRPDRMKDAKNSIRELFEKYRFQNLVSSGLVRYEDELFPNLPAGRPRFDALRKVEKFTPEMLESIERLAYEALKDVPTNLCPVVAFANEEESSPLVNGATDGGVEYGKAQFAFYKGAKRANSDFQVAPTHGTSGWSKLRGRKAIDQYLNAANLNGFKYDAVCVHPYGNVDCGTLGRGDAAAEIDYMRELLAKHGYDPVKTPLYMSECWNVPVALVPSWGCDGNQDAYPHGKTGYDFGNREWQSACQVARMYLIYLKYWPQVRCVHCWMDPMIDAAIQPMMVSPAVNIIGHLLPDPVFVDEVRPVAGVRAYVWKSRGRAVAAVWAVDQLAELGRRRCPRLNVRFSQKVRFLDFMGNERVNDGDGLQLTSAPLYIVAKDTDRLVADLKAAHSSDAASCLRVDFVPAANGTIGARLRNLTDRAQNGVLRVGGKDIPYAVAPKGESFLAVGTVALDGCEVKPFRFDWRLSPDGGGKPSSGSYALSVFAAPKCGVRPDWTNVPAHKFENWHEGAAADGADLSAAYQVCWNTSALFVRVSVKDSQLLTIPRNAANSQFRKCLWNADGALELYLDCGANGRSNIKGGYDDDDYRYDFAPPLDNKDGRGFVWRHVEVDHQLADGINMPSKDEASKNVLCDFRRTVDGYEYILTLPSRYIEPLYLRKGTIAGFSLYLHDKDGTADKSSHKAVTTGTLPGEHVQGRPELWPLMILGE